MEMVRSGDWLTPRLVGQPLLTKPPLFYWGEAVAFKLFGAGDRASRLPSLLGALLMIAGVWLATGFARGRGAAAIAAVVAATLPVSAWMAQNAEPEMLFAGTAALAMGCWSARALGGRASLGWYLGFWGMLALSAFTKGPMEPLPVLLTVGLWQGALRRRPVEHWGRAALGWLILLAPLAIWFGALAASGGHLAAIRDELQSHVGEDAPHAKPFGFYLDEAGHELFQWFYVLALAGAFGVARIALARKGDIRGWGGDLRDFLAKDDGAWLLGLGWMLLTWLLYSLVPSKRYYYGVAFAPPAGVLAGLLWSELGGRRWPGLERRLAGREGLIKGLAASGIALIAAGLMTGFDGEITAYAGERNLNHNMMFIAGGLAVLVVGVALRRHFASGADGDSAGFWRDLLAGMAGLGVALTLAGAFLLNPLVNRQQSLRRATEELAPLVEGRDDVASLSDAHTILFYLGRTRMRILDRQAMDAIAKAHAPTRIILYSDTWDEDVSDPSAWRVLYESRFILKKGAKVLVVEAK
jgi:4-amino-4-deoxy-L-arabinose transferase-like glycosyltransferase